MTAKCPTCKQVLPPVEGWKVKISELGTSYHVRGALAWWPDGEEGLVVGQSKATQRGLYIAVRRWLAERTDDNKDEVDTIAVDLAAREIAATTGGERTPNGAIVWSKNPPRNAVIHRANELVVAELKQATEEASKT